MSEIKPPIMWATRWHVLLGCKHWYAVSTLGGRQPAMVGAMLPCPMGHQAHVVHVCRESDNE